MSYSRVWLLSLSALVAACGGGGNGDPPQGNAAPRALAGPDQVQNEGTVVTLDGGDSFDPNGTIQAYLWEQTAGPGVSLTGGDTASPRFTAPATTAPLALNFRLTVTDNAGATDTDEVGVTVNPVNLAPVARNDSATTAEDTAVSIAVLTNDTDPDDAASTSDPAEIDPASITVSNVVGGSASVANGRVQFSPAVNFNGAASFRYTVADRHGAVSSPATVSIAVTPVNDAPTISAISDLTIAEDGSAGPIAFTVADIDTPVEQLSLTAGSDTQALVPDSAIVLGGAGGNRTVSATPVADRSGLARLAVRVTDADGAFATEPFALTVTAVNDAPVASATSATGDEDRGAIAGTLSASDIDSATLSYRSASAPANGSVTVAAGGTFEYTPAVNFAGTDSFTFIASDGALDSAPATVTLTVNELGEAVLDVADATLGEAGGTLDFVVSLSRAPDGPVRVDFASADGSARAGQDYAAATGSLAFTPDGPRSQLVRVPVTNDTFDENDEGLSVALSVGAGAASTEPGDLQAAGLIQDDDTSDLLRVGAARRSVKPSQAHIDGVVETRLGGTERTQKFNLGGFGINPLQSFPDPADQAGEQLTQPAETAAFSGSRGEEPIQLRVMLMEQLGGERLAFVTLDAIGAGNIIQDGVKAAVSGVTGIAPENILFGQTHSHAGPDLQGLWGGVPEDWIQNTLYVAAAEAAAEALAASRPARLTLAQGQTVQFNNYRRPRINPGADADGTLTLLEAVGDDGTPVGSILQYNAHPTSIDEDPRSVHADYIQGAMDWIEAKNGGVGLYYNGPIADASGSGGRAGCTPAPQDGNYGNVRCRGEGIADQALQYSKRELAPTLAVDEREVILPITNPGFLAFGAIGSFNRYYNFVQQVPVETIPGIGPEAKNLPQATPTATTLVSRVTVGGATGGLEIVTIPGETTNTFGQYIRSLAQTNVMLLGLTHNSFGYILPEEEFSYVDQTGDAGLVAPFTGYEENVSLGPLTAPLLRSQGYNRLFGVDPTAGDTRDLPPSLLACFDDMDSPTCLLQVIENRIDLFIEQWIAGGAATLSEFCHDNAGDFEAICAIPDTLAGLVGGLPVPGAGSDADLLAAAADAQLRGCDLLDTSNCLYPFPNDWFTAEAAPGTIQHADQGGTGRRVNLSPLATPRNSAGKPVDPTEWNRSDGFSPGALIATYVPQLSLEATFARPSHEIGVANLALSQDPDAPILVLEVQDDGRAPVPHRVWSEIDQNANLLTITGAPNVGTFPIEGATNEHGHVSRPLNDGKAALLIRPGKNFAEGKRYVVVLRNLKNADGATLAAQAGFRACLAGDSALPPVQARCEQLQDKVFPVLEDAGIALDDSLYLAWDFTVESTGSAIGRLRHMRDTAFASLSSNPAEDDCTQLTPTNAARCAAPKVEITTVTENPQNGIARRIEGMLTVPNYLAPVGPSPLDNPQVAQAIVQMCANAPEGEFASGCSDLRDGADLAQGAALPSRLFYNPADGTPAPDPSNPFDPTGLRYGDGLPDANGTMTTRFLCQIPAQATPDNPARASLYGHGQLDRGVAITYEGTPDVAREHNYMFCAVDWFGFRTGDAANVASALVDLSNFPVIPDASQQGMLNFMFLARAMGHPQGLGALPEFQGADGRPLFDAREIFYNGNSQGGIFGGVVLAASKDVNRGVLGSLGMNYSTLLTRSKNFDEYAGVLYSSYTDPLDRQLLFSMMQMLWDRSENNGYAHHITDNTAFGGPANVAKLDPMFGDPQVTMFSAEVMARTMGVPFDNGQTLHVETLGAQYLGVNGRRHPGVVAYEGLDPLQYGTDQVKGSALVVWDTNHAGAYSDIPPITNTPPRTGVDNHDASQKAKYGRCHMAHFLRTGGELIDIRGVQFRGEPCPAVPPAKPTVLPGAPEAPADVLGDFLSALAEGDLIAAVDAIITPVQQAFADAFSDGAQQAGELAGIALPTPGRDPAPDLRAPEALRAGVAKRAIQVPVGTPLGGYLRPPVGGEYIGPDPVGELTDNIPAMADGCDPEYLGTCQPHVPVPDELRKVTSPFATYSPPSRGYYDSLIAKAVALHDGHDYVVLVKTDFIGMLDELVQDVKAEVKARKGIELGDGLIMSATHSHDGPGAVANHSTRYFWLAMDAYQPEVYRRVVGQLADVVVAALDDLRPARIGHGTGLEREGLNGYRRGRLASYADNDEPDGDGLTDADELRSRIGVLRVDDAVTGETRALVINWAAHGIAFDVENQYFSGDVLGAVERETEQLMDIDVAMLVQSVGGDVSPRGVSNDNKLQRIESYGKRLAPQVKAVAESIGAFQDAPDLRAVSQRIVLNRERLGYADNEYPYPWGAGQCGNDIAVPFADVGVRDIPGYEDSGLPVKHPYCIGSPPPDANDLADNGVAENGAFYPQDTILTAARIGDITIMVQPGEPLVEYGVRLMEMAGREGFDADDTFVWGYAGDHIGYILPPVEEDWATFGGAESTTTFWGWKQGERFMDVTQGLLVALRDGTAAPADEFQVDYTKYREVYDAVPAPVPAPSILPGTVVAQPSNIKRFERTAFVFEGGDPVVDFPAVRMLNADGTPVRRANGEAIDTFFEMHLKYRLASGRHLWTVEFEAPKDWAAGGYRFAVSGKASQGGEVAYQLESDTFTVAPAANLQLTGASCADGECSVRASYTPVPSNYRVVDARVPADEAAPMRSGTVTFSNGSDTVVASADGSGDFVAAIGGNVTISATDGFGNTAPAITVGGANPDRDGDGVPNETDACPDQSGPASNNGCPEQAAGLPLCEPFAGYCLSDIPGIGEPLQAAIDTAYNTLTGGGTPGGLPSESPAELNDPSGQVVDCAGPAGDPAERTPEFAKRDADNIFCTMQRHADTLAHPANIRYMAQNYGADPYREPARLAGKRFRHENVSIAGVDAQRGTSFQYNAASNAEVYFPCAAGTCEDMPAGLATFEPPYPIAIVMHGAASDKKHLQWVSQPLAEHGYFVLTANGTGAGLPGVLLDWLFDPANPYKDKLDLSRIGTTGHSLGAENATRVQGDPRVSGIVAFDPCDGSGGNECRDSKGSRLHDKGAAAQTPTLFLTADYLGFPGYPQPQVTVPGDLRLEGFGILRDNGVDTMLITPRATTHLDWAGAFTFGNRLNEATSLHYTLAWFDRYVKAKLVVANGEVVTQDDRTAAEERAFRQAIADQSYARLVGSSFDGLVDLHNISQGYYDEVKAAQSDDPEYGGNVPYVVNGMALADRLSFYHRSVCSITQPDLANGNGGKGEPTLARADTTEDGDMRATGCVTTEPGGNDTDGDGFPDDVDECPTEVGPNNGCPAQPEPEERFPVRFEEMCEPSGEYCMDDIPGSDVVQAALDTAWNTVMGGDVPEIPPGGGGGVPDSEPVQQLAESAVANAQTLPVDLQASVEQTVANAQNGTLAQRAAEAVVMEGRAFADWSQPAAFGLANPYPSGVGGDGEVITGNMPFYVRDAHNGTMLYPPAAFAGLPTAAPVGEIAAFKYEAGRWVEIPVQVDERFPYFLANAHSGFSFYSGTDMELTYAWDRETWKAEGDCHVDEASVAPMADPVPGLDDDDEIVFMAQDAGAQAPAGAAGPEGAIGGGQEIALADPLAPEAPTFVYLFRREGGSSFAAGHYVRYERGADANQWVDRTFFGRGGLVEPDEYGRNQIGTSLQGYGPNLHGTVCLDGTAASARPSEDRFPRDNVTISTDRYEVYASGRWMVRNVRIARPGEGNEGNYGPDIVDRWKGRAFQQSPGTLDLVGFEDEQSNWEANSALLGERAGPIRAIREIWGADSGTNVTKTETYYRDGYAYRYRVRVHPIPPDGLYTSWDYNRSAMVPAEGEDVPGGRYYTAVRGTGVPIDGVNDDVGQIDRVDPVNGKCITKDGPRDASEYGGTCPLFFDAGDPMLNLPLTMYNWEQIAAKGDLGSLVYLFELKSPTIGANAVALPYYRDDACLDDATGDDPVARPYPGESYSWNGGAVPKAYQDLDGDGQVDCHERQGAHAQHGVHFLAPPESDNAMMPVPVNEIDGQQWAFAVPMEAPTNVGERYANIVRVPLQRIVRPIPAAGEAADGVVEQCRQAGAQYDPTGAVTDVACGGTAAAADAVLGSPGEPGLLEQIGTLLAGALGDLLDQIAALFGSDADPANPARFKVGTGSADQTPTDRVCFGSGSMCSRSADPTTEPDAVRDPMLARATAITGANGQTFIVVTTTNIGYFLAYKPEQSGYNGIYDARLRIANATGVPSTNITVVSDHSHNGPDTIGIWGGVSAEYMKITADSVVEAAIRAYESRRDAVIKVAAVNQNDNPVAGVPRLDSSYDLPPGNDLARGNPYNEFRLLVADDADTGERILTFVNYAPHATVTNGDRFDGKYRLTGDWAAWAPQEAEAIYGGMGVATIGTVGSTDWNKSGDIPQREAEARARLRTLMAAATARLQPVSGTDVQVESTFVREPLMQPALLLGYKPGLDRNTQGTSPVTDATFGRDLRIDRSVLPPFMTGTVAGTYVSAIRVGDVFISTFPGEPFGELDHAIADEGRVQGAREHFLLGGANDFFGYMVKKPETYEQTARTGALWVAGCPEEDFAQQVGVRDEGEGACSDHWALMVSPTFGSHIVCTLQDQADRLGFTTANRDAECAALTALDGLAPPPESGDPAAAASFEARKAAVAQAHELAAQCRATAAPAQVCDALAQGAREAEVLAGVPGTTAEGDGRSYAGVAIKDASWHLGASAGQFAASGAGIASDRGYDPYGHSTRKVGSDILGTRITTRALVVQGANGQRIAIASNDLYLPNDLLHRRTAQLLAEHDLAALASGGVVTGITDRNLATTSSHSHTSPFYSTPAWGTWIFQDVFDLRFYEYMARQMADAVIEAASTMKPVRMGGATVKANDIQSHTYDTGVAHDGTPAGQPRDYTTQAVTVVSFDDISTGVPKPLANWVIFGVHPEWVWGEEIVNGDITHAVMRMLDRETGAVTLWSQRETGSSGPHKGDRVHLPEARHEFQESNFAGYDRAARFLTDSIKRALGQLASDTPERPDQFAAYQTGFDVGFASQRFAPPVTRPYPGTSNCNSDRVFEGDPGTVVVPGLPDCSYDAEEQLDPVTEPFWDALPVNPADLARQLNEAGVPVPTSYSGTSFTAVQETAAVHLQVFKLGSIAATLSPNEQFTSQALNIESRLDKVPDNLWHGFDFACVAQARGLMAPDSDPKIAGHCARQNARYPEERLALPAGFDDPDFPRARAQIHNDASGWELDPVYAANSGDTSGVSTLGGEAEPEDITQIKGNFTHEEFTDHGYDLVVSVGMANDYWGYMAEYREYRAHSNSYRKALNALGPHGADFVATRLARMAANLNGAGVALPYNPLDTAYQAESARAEGLARTLGELARAYTTAYDATLPPDGGVPGIVTQPAATVKRFSAATLKFVGGSNYTDMPRVRVERRVNGAWQTYGTQEGEVQLQLKFLPSAFSLNQQLPIDEGVGLALPDPQALALWRAGQFEWVWTANFEAFVSELDNLGGRPGITPAGTYRFVVDGQHRGLMSFPNAAPYQLVSQPFEVTAWDGITVEDLQVGTDGRVSFIVGPVNTFTQFREGPEADDPIVNRSPGYTVGPVDYPDSYEGGISWIRNERQLLAGDQQYCARCTFRPWADSAQLAVDAIPVTVTRANGSTTTLLATRSGDRWVTGSSIAVGASAQVPAGVIVDQYGERNGMASAVVARSAPPSDTDGDGIPDGADGCPAEPGPADNNGCPLPPADTDGDGVPDDTDACDTAAGPASNNGCPEEAPAADPLTQLIENVSTALTNFVDNVTATLTALADSATAQVEALVASPETAGEQVVATAQDVVNQAGVVNADNPWTRRRPLNISHRGGENDWPENTMFAYAESIRAAGSDMIEMDIYETADGELVVIHDDSVDRTTNGTGAVSSFTLAQLRALDAAYWFAQDGATRYGTSSGRPESQYIYRGIATGTRELPAELAALGYSPADFRIPTLREIFENPRFAGVLINIELKPDPDSTGQYEAKLAAMIREYGRQDDVIVASFLDHNLALFKANAPEVATSVPTGQAAVDKGAGSFPAEELDGAHPGLGATVGHKAYQVPMDFSGIKVLSAEYIADAHARGMAVHAWTINDRNDMVQLLNWCVDGIMSDKPLLLEEVLQSDEWSCPLDPAPATNLQHFIGSLHEHSGFSDGTIGTTPADYFAAGRAYGLDFMASSEHSDNAMAPVTANTECISEAFFDCIQTSPDGIQKWNATLAIADAAYEPGAYSAIRGFEWTSDRHGHINVFFSQNDLNAKTGTGYALSMEDFWQWLALPPALSGGADGLAVFNHPGREDQVHRGCVDEEVPEDVPLLGGQAVSDCLTNYGWPGDSAYAWNGMAYRPEHDGRMVGIEMYGKSGDDYDGDNGAPAGGWYAYALDRGWHVAPVGAEDEHGTNWGAPTFAKTVMLAKENTRAALRGAMAARRFYALAHGHGDVRIDFTAGASVMGSRLSRAVGTQLGFNVQVSDLDAANGIAAARIQVIGPGGEVLESATGLSHGFQATVTGGEQWRFVRVLDASGKVLAVSAPIWFAGR